MSAVKSSSPAQPSISASLVGSLIQLVSEGGALDPCLLMMAKGLNRRPSPDAPLARKPNAWLEERAFELSADPALGLHLGERGNGRGFGIVGQLAASSRTLRECIEVALRYSPLILEGQPPELRVEEGRALVIYPSGGGTPRSVRLSVEFCMARFAQFGRHYVGRRQGVECWFAYARPSYGDEYARVFGSGTRFDMPHNAIVIPEVLLDFPQPGWDSALHALLTAEAERALEQYSVPQVSRRARAILSCLRLGERPEMAHAAGALGLSERALRRRLAAEGVSFRELIDDMQRDRALILAKDPKRSAEAVSSALGFSEVSAYHRAFKRWTGLTPVQYRLAHRSTFKEPTNVMALSRASA